MKKSTAVIILIQILLFGCATVPKDTSEEKYPMSVAAISDGLPREGLWRENIVLHDMNGDGSLDIVTPPPRKAGEGQRRPFIFLWNPSEKKWIESSSGFPQKEYVYGGVAAGDMNGDGYPDIALAQHGRDIVLFLNDGGKGFTEMPLPLKEDFHSRSLALTDINADGRLDIIALSEAPFSGSYKPKGILVGINKASEGWDVKILEDSSGLFGDFIAGGNLRGEGRSDIAIAVLSSIKEEQKLIWLGDGKGGFNRYEGELFAEDALPVLVKTGDVDGDGKEETAFGLGLMGGGEKEKGRLAVMKWIGNAFEDISSGLNPGFIIAFDLVDIDGDGKSEIVVLTELGINIFKYHTAGWSKVGQYSVPWTDTGNVTDLRAGRNKDGSVVIVYNMGKYESNELSNGLKAYRVKVN